MSAIAGSTVISGEAGSLRSSTPVRTSQSTSKFVEDRVAIAALDDADLVQQTRIGNDLCFDELVKRYRDKAWRLVISTIGHRPEVEDIVQDVFVKVYKSMPRFRGDASFSTFLYTVTVNRCRDELRKQKVRKFFSFDDWFNSSASNELTAENGHRVEQSERVSVVRDAMQRLPKQTRMLLHLREIEELSYKELSEVFDVEIGTVKSRLARARNRLREELRPYMVDREAESARK